jgi:LuxR family transcriptional regulator, maltose regulon positive regulatory protein
MLPRSHLVERLTAEKDHALLLVTGYAGSGKTSLVCQWLEKNLLPVAWYALDETDNDEDLFFRYLLTSLGMVRELLGPVIGPWVEGQRRIATGDILPELITALAASSEPLYLVLDDYHKITNPEIHKFVERLVSRALPCLHVVILSRAGLPFSLSRMKMRGLMAEFSAEDLKLTYKETEQFFREIFPVSLSAGQLHELTSHMEGWLGGLQLFGLSLKGRETVDVLKNILNKAAGEAVDYLIDEVIGNQTEKVREFLYATTLLTRFNGDLCRAATGMSDAPEVLEKAWKSNLFLVPLDSEGMWYRYHNLFSKAVRKLSRSRYDESASTILRTAASWFAQAGYLEEAFRHAFASGDFEFAADMLEDHVAILYERYEIASFRRWLQKLPPDVFMDRALLRLFDCRFKIESVQLAGVAATLHEMEERKDLFLNRYEGAKRKLCDDLLLVLARILPDWYDPENVDIGNLENALQQITPDNSALAAFRTTIPFSYFYKGRLSLASLALRQASPAIFSSRNWSAVMIWYRVHATVERFQGRLGRSEAIIGEAFQFLGRTGATGPQPTFMLDLQMAWIDYLRNDIEKAAHSATTVLRYAEQTRSLYEIVDVYHLLALISSAQRETDKTDHYLRRMETVARDIGTPSLIALTEAQAVRIALAGGDVEKGLQWAARRKISLSEQFSFRYVTECLAWSELLTAQGRHDGSLEILGQLSLRCAAENIMEAVLVVDLLQVENLSALGVRVAAATMLANAIGIAEVEGYVRPFVDRASGIGPVLSAFAKTRRGKGEKHSRMSPFVQRLLDACNKVVDGAPSSGEQSRSRVGDLTRRETEILRLLSAGYRDKEIADKAFISLHTAKTHIKHIFEKLGVTTRVQAVRRAEELKIGVSS